MKKFLLLTTLALTGLSMFGAHPRGDRYANPRLSIEKNPFTLGTPKRTSSQTLNLKSRAGQMGSFYGWLYWSQVDTEIGLYEITPWEGYSLKFADPGYEVIGYDVEPLNGWYRDGQVEGISVFWNESHEVSYYYSYAIDFNTGTLTSYEEYNILKQEYFFDCCTLNENDGLVYGYVAKLTNDGLKYFWASAKPDDITNVHIISEAARGENFVSICFKADDNSFYGVTSYFQFAKIDIQGNWEYISDIDDREDETSIAFNTGLIWDPYYEVFFWNNIVYLNNAGYEESWLNYISLEGEVETVEQYSADQQFAFFLSPEPFFNENAPEVPVINNLEFEGTSLTGVMTATMPTLNGKGEALPESISYTAILNGGVYSTGEASPGEQVTVEYTVEKSGEYIFGIYATVNGSNSRTATSIMHVGFDVPKAPGSVVLSMDGISWEAVTSGVGGGYIDLATLEYKVELNGQLLGTTTETRYPLDLMAQPQLAKYVASVTAVCADSESAPGLSNSLVAGKPLEIPQSFQPTEEEFELMTVYNANNDTYYNSELEITWELTEYGLYSSGTEFSNSSMDDYVFLPPIYLKGGENGYGIIFDTGKRSDWYPLEYLNVVYASNPTPEGVQGYIMENYEPSVYLKDSNYEIWDKVSQGFTVPEDGVYYLGFQCVSEPMQWGVYVRNILVATVGNTPEGVSDLIVTPGTDGALNASLSFTLPTQTLDGENLTGNLSVEISVNGQAVDQEISGAPGSDITVTVPTMQGENIITVTVYNGAAQGAAVSTTVYTGVYQAATPENVKLILDADNMGGTLSWDAVTEADTEGQYIDPASVTYTVMVYSSFNPNWVVVEEGVTATSYHVSLESDAPQAQYAWGVMSVNAAGTNGEENYDTAIMGAAYDVPFLASFADGKVEQSPWLNWPVGNVTTTSLAYRLLSSVIPNYAGEDVYAMVGSNVYGIACNGLLSMPYFSTKGQKALNFRLNYMAGPSTAGVEIYANIYGSDQDYPIGEIPASTGDTNTLVNYDFEMPEVLMGQEWVQVYFKINFSNATEKFILERIEVSPSEGIDGISNDANIEITTGIGEIYVKGCAGKQVIISSVDGRLVNSNKASEDDMTYQVVPGIYVVKAGTLQKKIVVR